MSTRNTIIALILCSCERLPPPAAHTNMVLDVMLVPVVTPQRPPVKYEDVHLSSDQVEQLLMTSAHLWLLENCSAKNDTDVLSCSIPIGNIARCILWSQTLPRVPRDQIPRQQPNVRVQVLCEISLTPSARDCLATGPTHLCVSD